MQCKSNYRYYILHILFKVWIVLLYLILTGGAYAELCALTCFHEQHPSLLDFLHWQATVWSTSRGAIRFSTSPPTDHPHLMSIRFHVVVGFYHQYMVFPPDCGLIGHLLKALKKSIFGWRDVSLPTRLWTKCLTLPIIYIIFPATIELTY
jgi:hypothetical protein